MPAVPGLDVRHSDVQAGDVRLHVAEAGDPAGEPLLLVHGWPQHWWTWRKVMPALSERYRVIAVDLHGFGWSDAPAGEYAKDGFATDILALMDALGIPKARLGAHDWGGFAGFLACLRAPERFERYVALNIVHPWFRPPKITPKAMARTIYQPILATPGIGPGIVRHTGFIKTVLTRGAAPGFRWAEGERETFADTFRDPAKAKATSAVYRTFLTRELKELGNGRYDDRRLTVPTLFLTGEHDPVVTEERIAGAEGHADALELGLVADRGHFTPEEQPDELVRRMLAFYA